MGHCVSKPGKAKEGGKPGAAYSQISEGFQSLDLIFFRGDDAISDLIRLCEGRYLRPTSPLVDEKGGYVGGPDTYTHVGMVVRSDILDHPCVADGGAYIWEATISGALGEGVTNVDGESFLGVQLRDLRAVVDKYDAPADTRVATAPLRAADRKELGSRVPDLRERFTELFQRLNGRRYDANPFSLAGAMDPRLRIFRDKAEGFLGTEHWLFCSELVATVYQELEIFPKTVRVRDVIPMDLLGYDADEVVDGGVPIVVISPVPFVRDPGPSSPAGAEAGKAPKKAANPPRTSSAAEEPEAGGAAEAVGPPPVPSREGSLPKFLVAEPVELIDG